MAAHTRFRPAALALAVVFSIAAQAQQENLTPPHVRSAQEGDAKSPGASFGSDFVIEAGDSDAKATLSVSDFFRIGAERTARYRLQASAPFDREKADSVDVGTLSGLSAGTSLAFELSHVDWPDAANDRRKAADAVCDNLIPEAIEGYSRDIVNAHGGWRCAPGDLNEEKLQAAVKTLNDKRTACADKKAAGTLAANDVVCETLLAAPAARLSLRVEELLVGADERLGRMIDQVQTPISLWTVGATANEQKFSFALPETPTQVDHDDKNGWAVSAVFTRLSRAFLWSVGYSHEESYEAAAKVDICSPIGATGSSSCRQASLGAPTSQQSELAFAEVRWILPSRKLALSPRMQFDIEESEWAVRVPVYLVRNQQGAFTTGLALGYTSKDSDVGLAVFVGKEFAFFD